MFEDERVERELLRREFHANEMLTTIRYVLSGGGVVLGYADTEDAANALKEKMSELLICEIEIEKELV